MLRNIKIGRSIIVTDQLGFTMWPIKCSRNNTISATLNLILLMEQPFFPSKYPAAGHIHASIMFSTYTYGVYSKPLYVTGADYEKAFDSVS